MRSCTLRCPAITRRSTLSTTAEKSPGRQLKSRGNSSRRQTSAPRPTMRLPPEMILAFFSCIAQNPNNFRGADKPHKPENRARQINGDQSEHLSSDAL
ncbi:hypothetical protein X971_3799 [Agrobacterium tumefaciens LBA4213 (Ach5)]|nr:hypothetical protein X971_3799 [Agrobacterium tumefaciens LBA4213 (Ach5)]